MAKTTTYVGLDVHKDTIVVALAEMGVRGEVREYGKIANTPAAVKTLATKLEMNELGARLMISRREGVFAEHCISAKIRAIVTTAIDIKRETCHSLQVSQPIRQLLEIWGEQSTHAARVDTWPHVT